MFKKHKSKEDKAVHVKLSGPIPIRKSVLSTAIDAANMLTIYEDVVSLRKERTKILDSITGKVSEIHALFNQMTSKYLPNISIEEEHFLEDKKFTEGILEAPKVHNENSDSEVEKLKNELSEIEKKLRHL